MIKFVFLLVFLIPISVCDFSLLMPNVQTNREIILCHGVKIVKKMFIIGFDPIIEQASHILIYTCFVPGSFNRTWECESTNAQRDQQLRDVCGDDRKNIIFSWANDGTLLRLPEDVSFGVGGDDGPNYFVVNAHYHGPTPKPDSSGIRIATTIKPTRNSAGVYLLQATNGIVPLGESSISVHCFYNNEITIHPFAFRVHTHQHGVVVSAFRTRRGFDVLIGRRDPKLPQIFEKTSTKITIEKNDIINSVCKMNNNDDKNFTVGLSHHNEMCLFYLMYWVKGNKLPSLDSCRTNERINVKKFKPNRNYIDKVREDKKLILSEKILRFFKWNENLNIRKNEDSLFDFKFY